MKRWILAAGLVGGLCAGLIAAAAPGEHSARAFAPNVIIPQARAIGIGRASPVVVTEVEAAVAIVERVATTTIDVGLRNPTGRREEAEVLLPVPEGAAVRSFTFQGAGAEPSAKMLARAEARGIYDEIVSKSRDPALLEFAGHDLLRSSVFPVEANGTQRVRLVYEHLLPADGNRADYVLPRSEMIENVVPWKLRARIRTKAPLAAVYSPSHRLNAVRKGPREIEASTEGDATFQPGAFRLSILSGEAGVSASLLAYPDPAVGGGYFLLLAGLPPRAAADGERPIRREVTIVLDRSGSMRGEKMRQVREAALQVLEGLTEGEAFNLIVYNEGVDPFAPAPVEKTEASMKAARDFLQGTEARGGTNIHDALLEALRQPEPRDRLPIVLFLTDGLPTIGKTGETEIRRLVEAANPHRRRVFTFGVGADVNTPLLDKIAADTRGTATFVMPNEDTGLKIAQVFKRLNGPVLADAALELADKDGKPAAGRVRDLFPDRLPDFFEGDSLVLLGQYVGDAPLSFRLRGRDRGRARTFSFDLALDKATTRNAFVPRLWASRKIGVLVEAVRAATADAPGGVANRLPSDPKLKELVDEVVRLSKEFGVLTEYTAFLAREGTDLSKPAEMRELARRSFGSRMGTRFGVGSVNQERNDQRMRGQFQLNIANGFFDPEMNVSSAATVQQVNDRAFFRRNGQWVDSRVASGAAAPSRVVDFGSEEFRALAARLSAQNAAGATALRGEVLIAVDGETVLLRNPTLSVEAEARLLENGQQAARRAAKEAIE